MNKIHRSDFSVQSVTESEREKEHTTMIGSQRYNSRRNFSFQIYKYVHTYIWETVSTRYAEASLYCTLHCDGLSKPWRSKETSLSSHFIGKFHIFSIFRFYQRNKLCFRVYVWKRVTMVFDHLHIQCRCMYVCVYFPHVLQNAEMKNISWMPTIEKK